jgi:hypothetical protein
MSENLQKPQSGQKPAPLEGRTVQELQSLAAAAAQTTGAAPRKPISRAARLHLIDQLSRWGGSGLALFAGVSIFIAIVVARPLPMRAAVWAALVFGALYLCRRYRKEFRRGDPIASRPFRWRSYYTATLSVVSGAFGAGAFLLLPQGASETAAVETLGLMLLATAGAAAFHAAHRASAAAAALPSLLAISGAGAMTFGPSALTGALLTAAAAAGVGVALAAAFVEKRAAARFPRTSFQRREAFRMPNPDRSSEIDRAAAG